MEKRVPELNAFIEKLNIFTKLSRLELNIHLALESRVPRIFDKSEPLFADFSDSKQLPCRQIRKNMICVNS